MAKKVLKKKTPKKEELSINPKKETEVVEQPAKKPAKKTKVEPEKVGLYLSGAKLVKIDWETETEKTVKANGDGYSNSPLRKDRIYTYDPLTLAEYNDITKTIAELEQKQADLLNHLGSRF